MTRVVTDPAVGLFSTGHMPAVGYALSPPARRLALEWPRSRAWPRESEVAAVLAGRSIKARPFVVAAVAVAAAGAAVTAPIASADPPSSTLVANLTSVTVDIGGPVSMPVSVGLDSGCLNVFVHGQKYSVGAMSEDTGVATVSPDVSPGIHCGNTTGFTVATYSFATNPTAACAAFATHTTTIDFTPVSGPPGIQSKLAGTSIGVTVKDAQNLCGGGVVTGCPPSCPNSGDRMAAPGVTNAYLNAVDTSVPGNVVDKCTAAFGPKAWRGNLIKFIASWMPKPESIKEAPPVGVFADSNDWVDYVTSEVNDVCKTGIAASFDPTGIAGLSPYTP